MNNLQSSPGDDIRNKTLSSLMMAGLVTSLLALLLVQWSVERGIGVAMILFPILFGLAWVVGGWVPFLRTLGAFVGVFFWVTVKNIIPIPFGSESDLKHDPLLEDERKTNQRPLEGESVDESGKLADRLRANERFQTNRKRIFYFAAVAAAIGTILLYLDLAQLKSGNQSIVVPATWKETDSENMILAIPFIFVITSVPLCVLFANYSKAYLAASAVGVAYFGTAFLLIFRPSLPAMPIFLPYLILGIVLTGVGLMAEWVPADSSHVTKGEMARTKSQQ